MDGSPEESRQVQIPVRRTPGRGKLLLYLGAAPGVGKTYAMLHDACHLAAEGVDVVVGFVETHGRPRTAEQVDALEVIPTRKIPYGGILLQEMDTKAVIARRPQIALVDELAHTNAPGSARQKRYEDVFQLLDRGIDVHSTMNIQHMESLNDIVERMTGVRVRETVPDWVMDTADELRLVDMTPEALIRRMAHGNIYPPGQAKQALENFFTVGNLQALRDLALRATAKEVEDRLAESMHGGATGELGALREKVMVAVDHRPIGRSLIREGWRMAAALKGDLIVVYVEPTQGRRQAQSVEDERYLRASLQLASELGAKVVRLRGKVSQELIAYARANRVSQLLIGPPSHQRWGEFLFGSIANDVLRQLPGIDLHIVPTRRL